MLPGIPQLLASFALPGYVLPGILQYIQVTEALRSSTLRCFLRGPFFFFNIIFWQVWLKGIGISLFVEYDF